MMRSIGPVFGTPESSATPSASLPKSTVAEKGEMSPFASACDCAYSRHHFGFTPPATEVSISVAPGGGPSGSGSLERNATLKSAASFVAAPPGVVADAVEPGCEVGVRRLVPQPDAGGEPHAAATRVPGGVRDEDGELAARHVDARPPVPATARRRVAASVSSACVPWTVRNRSAGEDTSGAVRPRRGSGGVADRDRELRRARGRSSC